ncbi:MAG: adenine phosphoribosyltransferase [Oscillospiraceae bacterium]|nr:adenine phosphoribosyltransferase [Oscillospiraceae bacterium]
MEDCRKTTMENKNWPAAWQVTLGTLRIDLPLVRGADGFGIYAYDSMGRRAWNVAAAAALARLLAGYDFDILLTAESKAIGLCEELAAVLGHTDYVVLRKGRKLYTQDPMEVAVQSVTTATRQTLVLGRDQQELLRGKRVCVVDDVISTGGTLRAIYEVARALDCPIAVNACVLTEEVPWKAFEGVPVVRLDHIPLPAHTDFNVSSGG